MTKPVIEPGIRTRVWREGKVSDENYPLADVSDHLDRGDCLIWVDLTKPDHSTLLSLADELSLDPNAVEDAVAHDERPKATDYGAYSFVTAYATGLTTDDDGIQLSTSRISAFVMERVLVTVHDDSWEGLDDVVARWDELGPLVRKAGVDALLHGLLDHIVDEQFETIQSLDERIDGLEDGLFNDKPQTREEQRNSFQLRRAVVAFRRVATPMSQMIATLHRLRGDAHPEMDSYWADLDDHIARVVEWTETARDMLTNVFTANMSLQDARMNMVMKKLTAWAAIIAVPTAITGFYGQNIKYPDFGTTTGFIASTSIIVVAMVLLYVTFKRRDWL